MLIYSMQNGRIGGLNQHDALQWNIDLRVLSKAGCLTSWRGLESQQQWADFLNANPRVNGLLYSDPTTLQVAAQAISTGRSLVAFLVEFRLHCFLSITKFAGCEIQSGSGRLLVISRDFNRTPLKKHLSLLSHEAQSHTVILYGHDWTFKSSCDTLK